MRTRDKRIQVMRAAAVASLLAFGNLAEAQTTRIVNSNNLDTPVSNESTASSQTEGVKDGSGENNGGGATISSSDSGAEAYWQGFQTGPSGVISQLTLDLSVVASSPGVNASV